MSSSDPGLASTYFYVAEVPEGTTQIVESSGASVIPPSASALNRQKWIVKRSELTKFTLPLMPVGQRTTNTWVSYFGLSDAAPALGYENYVNSSNGTQKQMQMQNFENATKTELRKLSERVEALVYSVESITRAVLENNIGSTNVTDNLNYPTVIAERTTDFAAFLNQIADELVAVPSDIGDAARGALFDEEPNVRAAASRVLSLINPLLAIELLTESLKTEQNKFVASVFRGALRAAVI